jgi:hypothetical protein
MEAYVQFLFFLSFFGTTSGLFFFGFYFSDYLELYGSYVLEMFVSVMDRLLWQFLF